MRAFRASHCLHPRIEDAVLPPAWPLFASQPSADGRGQLVGRRDGQNDLITKCHRVSATELEGKEGLAFARTFEHNILLTFLLGLLEYLQQNYLTWMIPGH